MPLAFRACIVPSAKKTHIRCYNNDGTVSGNLVLCKSGAPARLIAGVVPHQTICLSCIKEMARLIANDRRHGEATMRCDSADALAIAIGVERII